MKKKPLLTIAIVFVGIALVAFMTMVFFTKRPHAVPPFEAPPIAAESPKKERVWGYALKHSKFCSHATRSGGQVNWMIDSADGWTSSYHADLESCRAVEKLWKAEIEKERQPGIGPNPYTCDHGVHCSFDLIEAPVAR